jgi:predicted RNA-binding protein with RPS1 domain
VSKLFEFHHLKNEQFNQKIRVQIIRIPSSGKTNISIKKITRVIIRSPSSKTNEHFDKKITRVQIIRIPSSGKKRTLRSK